MTIFVFQIVGGSVILLGSRPWRFLLNFGVKTVIGGKVKLNCKLCRPEGPV